MSTEANPCGTMIGRPLGLTYGSIGEKIGMGGGIPPSPRGSMVLGDPSSLTSLVLTKFSILIILASSITSLLKFEGRSSS